MATVAIEPGVLSVKEAKKDEEVENSDEEDDDDGEDDDDEVEDSDDEENEDESTAERLKFLDSDVKGMQAPSVSSTSGSQSSVIASLVAALVANSETSKKRKHEEPAGEPKKRATKRKKTSTTKTGKARRTAGVTKIVLRLPYTNGKRVSVPRLLDTEPRKAILRGIYKMLQIRKCHIEPSNVEDAVNLPLLPFPWV